MQIGEKIKMLMDEKGWTIYRLAKVTGCSQSTVARWVNGEGVPQKMTMVRIAEAFGVSVSYLQDEDAKTPATADDDGRYGLSRAYWEQIGKLFNTKLAAIQKAPAYLATEQTGLSEEEVDAFLNGAGYVTKAQIHAMSDRMGMKLEDVIGGLAESFDGSENADIAQEEWLLRVARTLPAEDRNRLADYAHILATSRGLPVEEPPTGD